MIRNIPYYEMADVLPKRHRVVKTIVVERTAPSIVPRLEADEVVLVATWGWGSLFWTPRGFMRPAKDFKTGDASWIGCASELDSVYDHYTERQLAELEPSAFSTDPYREINERQRLGSLRNADKYGLFEGRILTFTSEPVLEVRRDGDRAVTGIEVRRGEWARTEAKTPFYRLDHSAAIVDALVDVGEIAFDDKEAFSRAVASDNGLTVFRPDLLRFDHDLREIRRAAQWWVEVYGDILRDMSREEIMRFVDLRDTLSRPDATAEEIAEVYFAAAPLTSRDRSTWLATRFQDMVPPSDEEAISSISWG